MSKDTRYLIFREYTAKQRPNISDRLVFYGWSKSKQMVLAFLEQRSPKKYRVRKSYFEEIKGAYGEDLSPDTELDFAELKSAKTHETIYLIMTKVEMQEAEKKAVRMFREASSLEKAGSDIFEVLTLFVNLADYYAAALFFLGFRPSELDALFPSADAKDDYSNTDELEQGIDEEYEYAADFKIFQPVAPWITEDVSKQMIYSFETFVKVLRDDM